MDIRKRIPYFARNWIIGLRAKMFQIPTRFKIKRLLNTRSQIYLEIGGGAKKGKGPWLTVDLDKSADLCWDLRRGLPFPDNSVASIYSSHTLEHFMPHQMQDLLLECKRILITGGFINVAVPNARIWIEAYCRGEEMDSRKYLNGFTIPLPYGRLDTINFIAYMDGNHKYLFDDENLQGVLKSAGFQDIKMRKFDPEIDLEERKYESIYAQGQKTSSNLNP